MLEVNLQGFREVDLYLGDLEDKLDEDEILDLATASALSRIRQRFHLQVSPDGIPWKPSKLAQKENRNTLLRSGRLFNSIQLFTRGKGFRLIGTDVEYAPDHNLGIGQEKREFMGLNLDDAGIIEQIILARLKL